MALQVRNQQIIRSNLKKNFEEQVIGTKLSIGEVKKPERKLKDNESVFVDRFDWRS
jgi:hypothetical protein